uniref:Sulfatase modifying factor 2 n=1 Tax=Molossus molossus TaxID=27622 RepID=A0A7J8J3X9_MOLMO|nr:sulfatase modifying factor 2 [Molossus molossus]
MSSSQPLLTLLSLLSGLWIELGNGQVTSMVQLPGGRFQMGTNSPDGRDGEGPVREVTVKPFAIDIFPVTNKDFREFVREKKYRTEAETFGWSFVFEDFVSDELRNKATQQMKVRKPELAAEGTGVGPGHRILWDMESPGPQQISNLRAREREDAREALPEESGEHHSQEVTSELVSA